MRWAALPIGVAAAIALAGCTQQEMQGFLPGDGVNTTNHTPGIIAMWTTAWILLLIVGIITWGLILWAAIVYRRRRGQSGLPVQMRYHLPIEIAYTIIPFVLIIGFFAFTAKEQTSIEQPHDPEVEILAYGKQWSWDFSYVQGGVVEEAVHEPAGVQAQILANGQIDGETVPTLWLPVDKQVKIDLGARDVIHSFWVIDFLYKKDMIPGKDNFMYFIPTKVGEYYGKCAELCGEYHSQMLFKVKVVEQDEFQAHLAELAGDGFTGELGADLDRNQNFPATGTQPSAVHEES
ncbi:MAG: cytochrome c oxidase subunit II [Micrococcales bacterium 73-13]|nr:MAG: cytochrome c oxidase subunit II [Micrococcales bacterium 73-13]